MEFSRLNLQNTVSLSGAAYPKSRRHTLISTKQNFSARNFRVETSVFFRADQILNIAQSQRVGVAASSFHGNTQPQKARPRQNKFVENIEYEDPELITLFSSQDNFPSPHLLKKDLRINFCTSSADDPFYIKLKRLIKNETIKLDIF
jgi:hypothetical protein